MTINNRNLYYLYDTVYCGLRSHAFKDTDEFISNKEIVKICRYACEYYLKWDPEYTVRHFDESLIDRMRLTSVVVKYLKLPQDISQIEQMDYLLWLMYPDHALLPTKASRIIHYYSDMIVEGSIKRCFFSGNPAAEQNARICYLFALIVTGCKTKEDCINFVKTADVILLLKKAKLYTVLRKFKKTPLEFLQDAFVNCNFDEITECTKEEKKRYPRKFSKI